MDNCIKPTEGHSTSRPPLLIGSNYNFWKTRMRIFLSSTEFDIWQIIEDGYERPPTPRSSWTEGDKRAFTINAKARILCLWLK